MDWLSGELILAFEAGGCPICAYLNKVLQAYFFWFARENISSLEGCQSLVSSGGFCPEHTQRFEYEIRSVHRELSASKVYAEILEELLSRITVCLEDKKSTGRVKRHFKERVLSGICPACETVGQSEEAAVSFLLERFEDFEPVFRQSQGLCVKHLLHTFEVGQDRETLGRLAEIEKERLTGILEDLRSFARKSDYRYRSELTEREHSAWLRAISKLTGRREAYEKAR